MTSLALHLDLLAPPKVFVYPSLNHCPAAGALVSGLRFKYAKLILSSGALFFFLGFLCPQIAYLFFRFHFQFHLCREDSRLL